MPQSHFLINSDGTIVDFDSLVIGTAPGPVGDGYIAGEDTNFVTGDSPVTIDVNGALSRNANAGFLVNDGPGDIQVEIDETGAAFGNPTRLKQNEVLSLDGINASQIRLTWIADSAYRFYIK